MKASRAAWIYCDVTGFTQKMIGFDVRMPTNWNGKMYFAGNRGFAGHIRYNTSDGLTRNYATVSTDTGHQTSSDLDILDGSWALNDRPAEIDFGFRVVHLTAVLAKTIIATYYGSAAKFSYFNGCSTGGGQSVREAEMFPEDFDGYIATLLQDGRVLVTGGTDANRNTLATAELYK